MLTAKDSHDYHLDRCNSEGADGQNIKADERQRTDDTEIDIDDGGPCNQSEAK